MPDRSQVIIRIVPGGGTKTLQQIINQLEYLSRKGTLELQRSARHLDIFVPPDNIRDLARSWIQETGTYDESQPDEERQKELTTHIIVSFPAGTSQPAAYAASREWAAETFGSGEGEVNTTILRPSTLIAITHICMSSLIVANSWDTSG